MYELFKITRKRTAVYHPQCSGQDEISNKTIKTYQNLFCYSLLIFFSIFIIFLNWAEPGFKSGKFHIVSDSLILLQQTQKADRWGTR